MVSFDPDPNNPPHLVAPFGGVVGVTCMEVPPGAVSGVLGNDPATVEPVPGVVARANNPGTFLANDPTTRAVGGMFCCLLTPLKVMISLVFFPPRNTRYSFVDRNKSRNWLYSSLPLKRIVFVP